MRKKFPSSDRDLVQNWIMMKKCDTSLFVRLSGEEENRERSSERKKKEQSPETREEEERESL